MIKNFRNYLPKIISSIQNLLDNAVIYLFGSALEEKTVASSDIDILIVANIPKQQLKRAEILAKIEEKAKLTLNHPFEFHLLTPQEFKSWNSIYHLKLEKLN